MDLASVIGLVACGVLVVFGIVFDAKTGVNFGSLVNFLDVPSAIITFGGAFMCIMAGNTMGDFVAGLNMAATGGLKPDVTFFFDISAEEALARRGKRGEASDRIELAGLKFQEDVRKGYLELAKDSDGRIVTIDATLGIDEIFKVVKESLEGKI